MNKIYYFLITFCLLLSSCSLFETRDPESPDDDTSLFIPPTSPEIVIENLIESIQKKNVDNYGACLIPTGYEYLPSSDAKTHFPSLFDNWQISDEKRYLLSLSTSLGKANDIQFILSNKVFETINSDSAVLISNYSINYDLQNTPHPLSYAGKASFTIIPIEGGRWAISRWQDFVLEQPEENIKETISFLKAYFN